MESFDVIIVGAGPAGGQCARELSKSGTSVLLTDKSRDFTVNNYSSAGAPNELMEKFQLPESIVGASWNKINVFSSNTQCSWEDLNRQGVVMEFSRLRHFLAEEMEKAGGELRMGLMYQRHHFEGDDIVVEFKESTSRNTLTMKTRVLVDATGCEKQVLAASLESRSPSFPSIGIEYLVDVDHETYQKWANALSVFMGRKWMPQGYSWIFPMEPNRLKVGVGRYFHKDQFVPHKQSYPYYLENMMKECFGRIDFPVLDKHGKTIVYTYGQKDPHYHRGVVAIGDAVSSINPLAFEGIRHAMHCGRVVVPHIHDYLAGNPQAFISYVGDLKNYFGMKWFLCEKLMKMIYRQPSDERVDLMLQVWGGFSMDEMIRMAFFYDLGVAMRFVSGYSWLSTKHLFNRLVSSSS